MLFFLCMHIKKKIHTSPHTTSSLACALQTHTSSSVTSSVKTYALINQCCLASLCHLVVVSDQACSECVCTLRIYVCLKGLFHIDYSENGVKKFLHVSLCSWPPVCFSKEKKIVHLNNHIWLANIKAKPLLSIQHSMPLCIYPMTGYVIV